jgi:hypothetical protein
MLRNSCHTTVLEAFLTRPEGRSSSVLLEEVLFSPHPCFVLLVVVGYDLVERREAIGPLKLAH